MGGLLFVGDGLPGMLLYGLGCLVSIFQGIKELFHKRLIAKLFGEYLSFFQLPFILVARLK
jgi:hypothetical protein